MSDRYAKLFALTKNLYSVGAPVVIAAGAIQKDNQTGKVLAQLKLRNIQDKAIKAATVRITPFDTVGKPLGETFTYQYLDLTAERDADFGQKTPVMFRDTATRSFAVSVSEVIFSDNSIWTDSGAPWEPLSPPVTPEQAFEDSELAKQYRLECGAGCKCVWKREKDLWRCVCGALNHEGETSCHSCQKEAAALAALEELDRLKANRDRRVAVEQKRAAEEEAAAQKRAAEEKAAAEARARKAKKIAVIATPIVVAAIVAAVLISNAVQKSNAYNAAVSLFEAGQYDEAIDAFTELGNYKDSAEQITETTYQKALALAEAGSFEEAVSIFTELGAYKDSAEQKAELSYQKVLTLLGNGGLAKAVTILGELGDYKDSQEILTACEPYAPYCGEFTAHDDGQNMKLISKFYWDDGDVYWHPETPDKSLIGLRHGSSSHYFFESGSYSMKNSMEAKEVWQARDCIGTATFKNGTIHITVKTGSNSQTFWDINYTKDD